MAGCCWKATTPRRMPHEQSSPADPFAPVALLYLVAPPDSEFYSFLQEGHRLVAGTPGILDAIDADLDLHGQRKKALRIQDAQWEEARNQPLTTIDRVPAAVVAPESLLLGVGRPRTAAYVVYLFLIGRGFYGGFKLVETFKDDPRTDDRGSARDRTGNFRSVQDRRPAGQGALLEQRLQQTRVQRSELISTSGEELGQGHVIGNVSVGGKPTRHVCGRELRHPAKRDRTVVDPQDLPLNSATAWWG